MPGQRDCTSIGGDAVKRRQPPPKRRQSGPTVEQMAAAIAGQSGLFILEFSHEDNCKTITSQRWEDCTCGDQVDHQLKRYQPKAGAA